MFGEQEQLSRERRGEEAQDGELMGDIMESQPSVYQMPSAWFIAGRKGDNNQPIDIADCRAINNTHKELLTYLLHSPKLYSDSDG